MHVCRVARFLALLGPALSQEVEDCDKMRQSFSSTRLGISRLRRSQAFWVSQLWGDCDGTSYLHSAPLPKRWVISPSPSVKPSRERNEEGVSVITSSARSVHHLAASIDAEGVAATPERAQVGHHAVFPEKGVRVTTSSVRPAHNLFGTSRSGSRRRLCRLPPDCIRPCARRVAASHSRRTFPSSSAAVVGNARYRPVPLPLTKRVQPSEKRPPGALL